MRNQTSGIKPSTTKAQHQRKSKRPFIEVRIIVFCIYDVEQRGERRVNNLILQSNSRRAWLRTADIRSLNYHRHHSPSSPPAAVPRSSPTPSSRYNTPVYLLDRHSLFVGVLHTFDYAFVACRAVVATASPPRRRRRHRRRREFRGCTLLLLLLLPMVVLLSCLLLVLLVIPQAI